jgi:biopolymer transport protein TolR
MPLGSAFNIPGSSENNVKADINVTPLVDVCLVMLIIFMVVTPMMIKGADVNLPQTTKPEKMPEGGKQVTVAMTARGDVVVQGIWVPEDSLKSFFKDLHEQNPDKNVVIKGDRDLKYKQVRRLMKVLNEAGFSGVGLVAERKQTT